jgi:hypothetical protein
VARPRCEAYRRLKRDRAGEFYFDELELNALGLELLFKLGRIRGPPAGRSRTLPL